MCVGLVASNFENLPDWLWMGSSVSMGWTQNPIPADECVCFSGVDSKKDFCLELWIV
jgi:hypothetical protein